MLRIQGLVICLNSRNPFKSPGFPPYEVSLYHLLTSQERWPTNPPGHPQIHDSLNGMHFQSSTGTKGLRHMSRSWSYAAVAVPSTVTSSLSYTLKIVAMCTLQSDSPTHRRLKLSASMGAGHTIPSGRSKLRSWKEWPVNQTA